MRSRWIAIRSDTPATTLGRVTALMKVPNSRGNTIMQSEFWAMVFGDRVDPRRRLEVMFGGVTPAGGPPPAAREWAAKVLNEAGIDPATSGLEAIKCLRSAHPRPNLRASVYLAQDAAKQ